MEEIETKLIIDASRIDPEGEILEGEVDCVDIDEEFVKPFGGIRYRLDVQILGTEMLVRGHLEQDFDLVCSRCGKDFDTTVSTDDFTESYELAENTGDIDITDDIRDAVLLELPNYPLCDENCVGLKTETAMPADDRWSALDLCKIK